MVFHDQEVDIQENVLRLDTELSYLGLENLCIHTGPIIRKEEIYKDMGIADARMYEDKEEYYKRYPDKRYR